MGIGAGDAGVVADSVARPAQHALRIAVETVGAVGFCAGEAGGAVEAVGGHAGGALAGVLGALLAIAVTDDALATLDPIVAQAARAAGPVQRAHLTVRVIARNTFVIV